MLYCSTFEFSFHFVSIIFWESSLFLQLCFSHTSLSRSAPESSSPSSWSCFYEAMTLLLQRCASGHCPPEWWNFSLGVFQQDPEGFGATPAVIRSSFSKLGLKSRIQLKRTLRLKREDAFLFMRDTAPEVSYQQKREQIHFKGILIPLQLIKFQSNALRLCWCLERFEKQKKTENTQRWSSCISPQAKLGKELLHNMIITFWDVVSLLITSGTFSGSLNVPGNKRRAAVTASCLPHPLRQPFKLFTVESCEDSLEVLRYFPRISASHSFAYEEKRWFRRVFLLSVNPETTRKLGQIIIPGK